MVIRLYKKVNADKEILAEKVVIKQEEKNDDTVFHLNSYFLTPYITDVVYGSKVGQWFTVDQNEYMFEKI